MRQFQTFEKKFLPAEFRRQSQRGETRMVSNVDLRLFRRISNRMFEHVLKGQSENLRQTNALLEPFDRE